MQDVLTPAVPAVHRRVAVPGVLLGVGLGGLADGIVLHQLLQWHHMLTSAGGFPATTVAGLEANTLADGLFHVLAVAFVVAGVAQLARREAPIEGRTLVGSGLVGWGLFNLVEGVVDHHLMGVHHVREVAEPLPWDLAFLAFGAVLVLVGLWVTRTPRPEASRAKRA